MGRVSINALYLRPPLGIQGAHLQTFKPCVLSQHVRAMPLQKKQTKKTHQRRIDSTNKILGMILMSSTAPWGAFNKYYDLILRDIQNRFKDT